jgi:hypothetical protein
MNRDEVALGNPPEEALPACGLLASFRIPFSHHAPFPFFYTACIQDGQRKLD